MSLNNFDDAVDLMRKMAAAESAAMIKNGRVGYPSHSQSKQRASGPGRFCVTCGGEIPAADIRTTCSPHCRGKG